MIFTLSNLISWTSFFYSYPDSKMYVYSFRKNQIPKKLQLNPKLKPSLPVNTFTQWSKLKKKMKSISEIIVASKQKKLVIIVVHNQAIFINLRNSTFKKHKKKHTTYLLTSLKRHPIKKSISSQTDIKSQKEKIHNTWYILHITHVSKKFFDIVIIWTNKKWTKKKNPEKRKLIKLLLLLYQSIRSIRWWISWYNI